MNKIAPFNPVPLRTHPKKKGTLPQGSFSLLNKPKHCRATSCSYGEDENVPVERSKSRLLEGFEEEAATWRLRQRTQITTDYKGDVVSGSIGVFRRNVNSKQMCNGKTGDEIDLGSKKPKASVTYDYEGKRIVIDSGHSPVPSPVPQQKKVFAKPHPFADDYL